VSLGSCQLKQNTRVNIDPGILFCGTSFLE